MQNHMRSAPGCNRRRRGPQVALTAFYQAPGGADAYATTFFNQTIDIVETKKLVDVELISLYATIAALLAGLGAAPACSCRSQEQGVGILGAAGLRAPEPGSALQVVWGMPERTRQEFRGSCWQGDDTHRWSGSIA